MNLDGETNLKIKKALKETWYLQEEAQLAKKRLQVNCEQPNSSLYTFTGNLIDGKKTLSLSPNQLLLRGCVLRNTAWVCGLVVFTGHQSKVMMNSTAAPSKRSTLEQQLDLLIVFMFGLLASMCLVDAIGSAVWIDKRIWYLMLDDTTEAPIFHAQFDIYQRGLSGALNFLTMVTLYSTLIPISLYVSIEIVKYIQGL
eukprot:jgi/Botrbrau1/11689/Bobra.0195s0020.1